MPKKSRDDALKKCLDAYDANTPTDPREVAEALADFKSLTLKVKSAWVKNQIDTYKIVKKKSDWEYAHKDNHQKFDPVMYIFADAAEAMMKQVFELGVLHWESVSSWNNCCVDMGVWTLDITFKNRPKIHLKYDSEYPDKWDELVELIIEE